MAHVEVHLLGSKSGYTTLGLSAGVRADERAELEVLGFSDASSAEARARLERHATIAARKLRSGRFAVSRLFEGGTDDVGRPTVEVVTIVLERADYMRLAPGMHGLVHSAEVWHEARRSITSGFDFELAPASDAVSPDVLRVYDAWVAARRAGGVAILPEGSADAIVEMVALLDHADLLVCRWGLGLSSISAPVDVCTLAPNASTIGARTAIAPAARGAWLIPEGEYVEWFVSQNRRLPASGQLQRTVLMSEADADDDRRELRVRPRLGSGHSDEGARGRKVSLVAAGSAVAAVALLVVMLILFMRRVDKSEVPDAVVSAAATAAPASGDSTLPRQPRAGGKSRTDEIREEAERSKAAQGDSSSNPPSAPPTEAQGGAAEQAPAPTPAGQPSGDGTQAESPASPSGEGDGAAQVDDGAPSAPAPEASKNPNETNASSGGPVGPFGKLDEWNNRVAQGLAASGSIKPLDEWRDLEAVLTHLVTERLTGPFTLKPGSKDPSRPEDKDFGCDAARDEQWSKSSAMWKSVVKLLVERDPTAYKSWRDGLPFQLDTRHDTPEEAHFKKSFLNHLIETYLPDTSRSAGGPPAGCRDAAEELRKIVQALEGLEGLREKIERDRNAAGPEAKAALRDLERRAKEGLGPQVTALFLLSLKHQFVDFNDGPYLNSATRCLGDADVVTASRDALNLLHGWMSLFAADERSIAVDWNLKNSSINSQALESMQERWKRLIDDPESLKRCIKELEKNPAYKKARARR